MSNSTSEANKIIARAYKAVDTALDTGNVADFAELLDPDVVLVEPASHPFPGQRWEGKDNVLQAVGGVLAAIRLSRVDLHTLLDDGETVCALLDMTSTNAAGDQFRMPMIEKWIVRNGKVVYVEPFYHDMEALKNHVAQDAAS